MKNIKIYKRSILRRTGFRKYPYKNVDQVSIFYDGKEYRNHSEDIENSRLRVHFVEVMNTRSPKKLKEYYSKLGRSFSDNFEKKVIEDVLRGGKVKND